MKVQAYIVTSQDYFDPVRSIFSTPEYEFNSDTSDERFMFYAKCAVETCITLGWYPDIMHCNGWRSALIPVFAKILYPNKFKKTKFVLSVSDFSKRGEFPAETFDKTCLPSEFRDEMVRDGKFSYLENGLRYADSVVTTSPEYAESLLEGNNIPDSYKEILKEKKIFTGIIGGVDEYYWNPKKDALIKHKLTGTLENFKEDNRIDLLHQYQLEPIENSPVMGIYIEPLEHCDLKMILQTVTEISKFDVQTLMIVREGDNIMQAELTSIRRKLYDNFSFSNVINDANVHQLFAGCDMMLYFPTENTGCQQVLHSLAYGTIPVVRNDGCMKSLITDLSEGGAGLVINGNTIDDIKQTMGRATELFTDKLAWSNFIGRAFDAKFTWIDAAKKYDNLYYSTLKEQ